MIRYVNINTIFLTIFTLTPDLWLGTDVPFSRECRLNIFPKYRIKL
jgi:hypothetical protein